MQKLNPQNAIIHPPESLKFERIKVPSIGKDVEQLELSYNC